MDRFFIVIRPSNGWLLGIRPDNPKEGALGFRTAPNDYVWDILSRRFDCRL
jgi:hypothetical protein